MNFIISWIGRNKVLKPISWFVDLPDQPSICDFISVLQCRSDDHQLNEIPRDSKLSAMMCDSVWRLKIVKLVVGVDLLTQEP